MECLKVSRYLVYESAYRIQVFSGLPSSDTFTRESAEINKRHDFSCVSFRQ